MNEHAMYWACPFSEETFERCPQPPICKGCLQPMAETGAPIWEYYCDNPSCKRTPYENLRDLFRIGGPVVLDETQQTVNAWVHECFPEWAGPRGRALAVVEEAIELALATGLTKDEIQSAVEVPIQKEMLRREADPNYKPEAVEGEIADTLLNVLAYAEEVGVNAHAALNAKMCINRSRPKEHYLAKTKQKKDLGLKL